VNALATYYLRANAIGDGQVHLALITPWSVFN